MLIMPLKFWGVSSIFDHFLFNSVAGHHFGSHHFAVDEPSVPLDVKMPVVPARDLFWVKKPPQSLHALVCINSVHLQSTSAWPYGRKGGSWRRPEDGNLVPEPLCLGPRKGARKIFCIHQVSTWVSPWEKNKVKSYAGPIASRIHSRPVALTDFKLSRKLPNCFCGKTYVCSRCLSQ